MKKIISVFVAVVSFAILTSFLSCKNNIDNNKTVLQDVPSTNTTVFNFDDYKMAKDALTNSKSSIIGQQMKKEKNLYGKYFAQMLSEFGQNKDAGSGV